MKCPENENHLGIKVTKCNGDSLHYAKVVCADCGLWIKWSTKEELDATFINTSLMEELNDASKEASEDVLGEKEWKEGDGVWFHRKAGKVLWAKIRHVYREWADLEGVEPWVALLDLYRTKEEAEKALSPAGRRMAGCIREAGEIYKEEMGNLLADDRWEITLKIAFRLFNTTED